MYFEVSVIGSHVKQLTILFLPAVTCTVRKKLFTYTQIVLVNLRYKKFHGKKLESKRSHDRKILFVPSNKRRLCNDHSSISEFASFK